MKKSKIVLSAVIILMLSTVIFSTVGCSKPVYSGTLKDKSFSEMKVADLDITSVDMLNKGMQYWKQNTNHTYTNYFDFRTMPFASQYSVEIIKRNGDTVLHKQAITGTGAGEDHYGHYRLFDGNRKMEIKTPIYKGASSKDKKLIKESVSITDGKIDKFDLSSWSPASIGEPDEPYIRYTEFMWLYNYQLSNLSAIHDSKIYEDKGNYYCSITIDTLNCIKNNSQPEVVADIEKQTKGKVKGFNADTVLKLRMEKVGDSYRIIESLLLESYKGVMTVTLDVEQYNERIYQYGGSQSKITAVEKELFG